MTMPASDANIRPIGPMQPVQRRRSAGFSMIELLVVMAIIATLAGLGVLGIPAMIRASERSTCETVLQQISAALEAYAANPNNGDFPPTALDNDILPGFGVRRNDFNMGIESVMVCLHRPNTTTSFAIEDVPWADALENRDGDESQTALTTISRKRDLWELVDAWGTPLAYFHHRDYDIVERRNLGRIDGFDGIIKAKPYKNPKTGAWYRRNGFQLISAGPDEVFNTEDDVTNFNR